MITSYKNPRVKQVRDLLDSKKHRDAEGLMVLEGVRLAEEAVLHGTPIQQCYFSANLSERGRAVLVKAETRGAVCEEIAADLMDRLSDTQHAQGILLVCETPQFDLPPESTSIIALDRVNDPGNIGTILRSAAALELDGVLLTPGTTDPFSPKAMRAAMGAQLHLPILWKEPADIKRLCQTAKKPMALIATTMECGDACWDADLTSPLCLIIGNEANGISEELLALSNRCVKIPIAEDVESFNAAVAAAVLMYEITRQRKKR